MANLSQGNFVKISGEISDHQNVSGIAAKGPYLIVGSDEGATIQFLKRNGSDGYQWDSHIDLFNYNETKGKEMDIESLALNGSHLYVIGSHSSKRKKVKNDHDYEKNREKFHMKEIEDERRRDWLYRLTIDFKRNLKEKVRKKISLRNIFCDHPVLKPFRDIPSKENGIDIEGLACKDGCLYIGFRGPVFRDNYVPVMKLKFDDPENHELLFVNLGGRGVRDMTTVSDGILILAGPVGDGPGSYQLYHWDGKDIISGNDRNPSDIAKLQLLGEISTPQNGKAEGVVVTKETKKTYDLIIVYDGVDSPEEVMQEVSIKK